MAFFAAAGHDAGMLRAGIVARPLAHVAGLAFESQGEKPDTVADHIRIMSYCS